MAENPSNGHAPDGQPNPTNGTAPLGPLVRAPEGARSARAFDGSPIIEEPEETTVFDETPASEIPMVPATDYLADFQHSFPPDNNGANDEPPLGISIEKIEPDDDDFNSDAPARARDDWDEADEDPDPYRNREYEAATQAGIDAIGADAIGADAIGADAIGADTIGADAIGADSIEGEQLFADDGAGGEPPADDTALATSGGAGRPDTPRDQEAGLFEHLGELRSRLLYAILGVMAVMCVTWSYALPIQGWFSAPINRVLNQDGVFKGELISTDPTAFFTLQFQSSLLAALILAAPWVSFQVWRFIEPALTNSERRYTLVLVPFSSVLFFMGAALGYVCAPLFFQFFLQFQPPGVAAQWRYDESVILMAKMLLIFGLSFQVPIVIIFGHKIGLISRNLLIDYWRHAVVGIFVVVAVLTPTWDPFTMTACALPPCLLYLLSIWLVKWL